MKICVFMHRFDDGGAEKVTIRLLNELAERGHAITLAVRYDEGPAKENLSERVRILDMKLPKEGKLKKNLLNIRILSGLMCSGEYDVMVAILSDMSQVAALAKWVSRSRIPLVSVVHSTLSVEKQSFRGLRDALANFFDRQYDKVVTVSDAVRGDYLQYCGSREDKVVTVYNPIVDDVMLQKAKEKPEHPWLEPGRGYKTLVLAGRLSYPKNHPLMFRALKLLRESEDYRLILLGEGELRAELTELAEQMDLSRWIDFHGYVKNPYGFMAHSDCVVLSSRYEGLPTVLVEALACGSRIVSTDCPSGPAEILEQGKYGILTPADDPEALAEGIRNAMKREPDREALLDRAMDFTVESATVKFEEELLKLI